MRLNTRVMAAGISVGLIGLVAFVLTRGGATTRRGPSTTVTHLGPRTGQPAQPQSRSTPQLADQPKAKARWETADVRAGIVVYADNGGRPANADDIPIGKRVLVACVAQNNSGIASINAFYLIASPPWRGLFASANQFANGVPVGETTNAGQLDTKVKPCR